MLESNQQALLDCIGKIITKIETVDYCHRGVVYFDDCQLQLTMHDESLIRFLGASDGQTVVISDAPWVDPFAAQETPENNAYIEKHGKWAIFNRSTLAPWCAVVGRKFGNAEILVDADEDARGVTFDFGDLQLSYVVDSDEGFIIWGNPSIAEALVPLHLRTQRLISNIIEHRIHI